MNTVLVTADALRADHLGQWGYERDTMPVLDRLFEEGARYETAYANAAHTKLSVPSFLTGCYDGVSPTLDGRGLASVLGDAGVATGGYHSNLVVTDSFGTLPGFDAFVDVRDEEVGEEAASDESVDSGDRGGILGSVDRGVRRVESGIRERLAFVEEIDPVFALYERVWPDRWRHDPMLYAHAGDVTERAVEWVEGAGEPFFLWVHYMEPHRPYGYAPVEPAYGDPVTEDEMFDLMARASVNPGRVTDAQRRRMIDLYDSDVRYMSDAITDLFDYLEREGLWGNTEVLFAADHGEEFGEHGLYFHRNKPYEELVRVPLVHRVPGGESEDRTDPRELVDVAPTVLESQGVDVPEWMTGTSLRVPDDGPLVSVSYRSKFSGLSVAVRDGRWKRIVTPGGEDELYDLETDLGETDSVLADHPQVADRLRAAVPPEVLDIGSSLDRLERRRGTVDEDTRERLVDLGYVE